MAATTPSTPPQKPTGSAPAPAYAGAPRRSGLLYALAGIVALAALAAMAIYMFGGRSAMPTGSPGEPRATGSQPSLDAAKAALDEASRSVLRPAPTSPAASDQTAAPPPMAAAAPAPSDTTSPAPAARVEPPPPAAEPPRAAPRPATPSAAAPRSASPPPKAAAAPPAPAAAPVPAPVQVANAEHFTQMRDEMARCSSSSLIPRIQCEQRIRARYCDGYWGTVPDCPTSGRPKG